VAYGPGFNFGKPVLPALAPAIVLQGRKPDTSRVVSHIDSRGNLVVC
jgi:hypothetical protein